MTKWLIFIIAICYMVCGFLSFSHGQEIDKTLMRDKGKVLEIYLSDKTDYPYEVIGKISYEGLRSEETKRVLKEKALKMGADAIINYKNKKGPYGYKAEGEAIRWKGVRKDVKGVEK